MRSDLPQRSSTLGLRSQPLACKSSLISAEFAPSGKPCSCKQRLLPCELPLAKQGSAGEGSRVGAVWGGCRAAWCVPARGHAGLPGPVATCEHRNWSFLPVPAFPVMSSSLPRNLSISCMQLGVHYCLGADQMLHRGSE